MRHSAGDLHPTGVVHEEVELTVVPENHPAARKFETTVVPHGHTATYYPVAR